MTRPNAFLQLIAIAPLVGALHCAAEKVPAETSGKPVSTPGSHASSLESRAAIADAGSDSTSRDLVEQDVLEAGSEATEPDGGVADVDAGGDTSVCDGVSRDRTKMGLSPREACVPVMRAYPNFVSCFSASATAKEGGGGSVTFLWTITASGSPFQIRATDLTLGGDLDFIDCLRGEIGKLRFPKSDKKTNMMWPFEFTPPKKKP